VTAAPNALPPTVHTVRCVFCFQIRTPAIGMAIPPVRMDRHPIEAYQGNGVHTCGSGTCHGECISTAAMATAARLDPGPCTPEPRMPGPGVRYSNALESCSATGQTGAHHTAVQRTLSHSASGAVSEHHTSTYYWTCQIWTRRLHTKQCTRCMRSSAYSRSHSEQPGPRRRGCSC